MNEFSQTLPSYVPVFVVLVVALIIYGVILSARADAKRRQDLMALCQKLQIQYIGEDLYSLAAAYGNFDWLSQGDSRRAYNTMIGSVEDMGLKMFDYQYYTGSGKSRERHNLSFVAIDTDLGFEDLTIRPETFMDRMAQAIGFKDINFESEEFSRAFCVKSSDKKFAYDVIHPKMMEFLLDCQGWSIELLGRTIMVTNGSTLDADGYLQAVVFVTAFRRHFPDYLVDALRVRTPLC